MMSIGCVTVSQSNPDLVWVGTGEVNNRQTTSFGDGVYKSTDGGKTFRNSPVPHGDNHDVWINPNNSDLMVQSNDGGATV